MKRIQAYYTIITAILTVGVLIVHFYSSSSLLAIIIGSLYLLILSFLLGKNVRSDEGILLTSILGLLFLLAGISLLATISYYVWQFNDVVFITLVILAPILIGWVKSGKCY